MNMSLEGFNYMYKNDLLQDDLTINLKYYKDTKCLLINKHFVS